MSQIYIKCHVITLPIEKLRVSDKPYDNEQIIGYQK